MARKTQQTFILHLHPQEYKIFQELIEDRGGEEGEEGKEREWEEKGEGNNLEI